MPTEQTDEGAGMDENGRSRRATVLDVAKAAGVSSATVSRVLNANYPVADATRARVHKAIDELGYVVNAHARALAGATGRTVGIIVNDVTDPFYAYISRGVERQASRSGRLCLVCSTQGEPAKELAFVDMLHERRADAVILVGGSHDDKGYAAELAARARSMAHDDGPTLVLCGRPSLGPDVPTAVVEYDNEGGGFALTDHLLSQEHRRILFLGGPPGLSTTRDRLAGHHRALRLRGIEPDPALQQTGAFNRRFGHERTRELLRAGRPAFTAVFGANDHVAAGAVQAIEEAGLRIPEDLSVAGYDNVPLARDLRPQLTTVHVPLEEMGAEAVRRVLSDPDEDSNSPAPGRTVRLGTHVVVRDSVAPPPPSRR